MLLLLQVMVPPVIETEGAALFSPMVIDCEAAQPLAVVASSV